MHRGAVEAMVTDPGYRRVSLPPRTPPENTPNFFSPVLWGPPREFADAIQALTSSMPAGYHVGDNFITFGRNMSLLSDKPFVEAWRSNAGDDPIHQAIVWRRYVLACAGYHCVQLDGDFVECGAYEGVGVKTIVDYLGGTSFPKQFWAYDAFEHDETMLHHSMPDHGPKLFEKVQAKFSDYPQVNVVKGLIPESLEGNSPDRIAYMHIDLNQAPAEVAALDHLFHRMVPGGIVILDDYEWSAYSEQKLAEDEWFDDRGYRVMPLPTGQGLVIKR